MLKIEDQTLTVTRGELIAILELPPVAMDSMARVWSVPADYREGGLFVAVQAPGQPEEIPACDAAAAQLLGEVSYPASQALRRQDARAAAHARIEAWRDTQERVSIVFEHDARRWDGGLQTRQRLQPVVALIALPDGFFWTDADNNDVPVTIEDLFAINTAHETAIVLRGFEIHAVQRAMKAALEALDLDELQSFNPAQWTGAQAA